MTRLAYHEAGHAVVAGRFGFHIKRAVLNDEGGGAVEYEERSTELEMVHWAIVSLAGPMAEQHYLSGAKDALLDMHGTTDYQQAWETLWAKHGDDGADAALARCEALAASYVTLNWPIIERVASALMRAKELSWPQLAPLLIRKASDR